MLIAVDGYNFIKQSLELRALEQVELQKAREGLIEMLAAYKRIKGHSITVVFDGAHAGRSPGPQGRSKGIDVVFSRPGEKADDILKRMAAEKREGLLVVTSDRDVADFAAKKGCGVIPVAEFEARVEIARYDSIKGTRSEDRGEDPRRDDKRGPSRRLSKSRRRTLAAAKKL